MLYKMLALQKIIPEPLKETIHNTTHEPKSMILFLVYQK